MVAQLVPAPASPGGPRLAQVRGSGPTGGDTLGRKTPEDGIGVGHARDGADPVWAVLLGQQPRRKGRERLCTISAEFGRLFVHTLILHKKWP